MHTAAAEAAAPAAAPAAALAAASAADPWIHGSILFIMNHNFKLAVKSTVESAVEFKMVEKSTVESAVEF